MEKEVKKTKNNSVGEDYGDTKYIKIDILTVQNI